MQPTPTLIFDFDGTLAQTIELALKAYNDMAKEHGFTPIASLKALQGKSVREASREFGVPLRRIPFIMRVVRNAMRGDIAKASPVPGIPELLQTLKADGFRLGILSSNAKENIEAFLQANDMAVFDVLYAGSSAFGKHRVLRRLLKDTGLKHEDVIYVGDETRDVEACKKCGVRVIGVTWGLHDEDALSRFGPDWIAKTPEDIAAIMKTLRA